MSNTRATRSSRGSCSAGSRTASLWCRNFSTSGNFTRSTGSVTLEDMQTKRVLDEFRNEPFTDYSKPENEQAMIAAIERVRGELGREYPCIINGEKISLPSKFESINPARISEVDTDTSLVQRALEAAGNAFKLWRNVPPAERAEYLFKVADVMRKRKHE